jgi:hypothetical protein
LVGVASNSSYENSDNHDSSVIAKNVEFLDFFKWNLSSGDELTMARVIEGQGFLRLDNKDFSRELRALLFQGCRIHFPYNLYLSIGRRVSQKYRFWSLFNYIEIIF